VMGEPSVEKLSRRAAIGAVAAAALIPPSAAAADPPSIAGTVERTYEGRSVRGRFEEALTKALDALRADLGGPDIVDGGAKASWRLLDVCGVTGGVVDRHEVRVKIVATCDTRWPRTKHAELGAAAGGGGM
jgi:hypothetical protein